MCIEYECRTTKVLSKLTINVTGKHRFKIGKDRNSIKLEQVVILTHLSQQHM